MARSRGVGLAVLVAGLLVTFVHDYAYRHADSDGTGDYVFGVVSHAGTDLLILTVVLAVVAWWTSRPRRSE